MRIPLDRQNAVPLYQQIETYLRQGILSGSLAADTRLPASRQLAPRPGREPYHGGKRIRYARDGWTDLFQNGQWYIRSAS